jgi:hypothetical protein
MNDDFLKVTVAVSLMSGGFAEKLHILTAPPGDLVAFSKALLPVPLDDTGETRLLQENTADGNEGTQQVSGVQNRGLFTEQQVYTFPGDVVDLSHSEAIRVTF